VKAVDDTFSHERPERYSPRRAIRQMRAAQLTAPVTATRSLVICTNPRAGSWALCTALARTGRAGYPSEYFIPWDEADWSTLWGARDPDEFVAAMVREGTSPNGVFGIKVMWGHVPHIQDRLANRERYRDLAAPDLFGALLPDPAYVWLSRRDTLRQAVSHALALRTGAWAIGVDQAPAPTRGQSHHVDTDLVFRLQQEIEYCERQWAEFFAAQPVPPLRVWYEDVLQDLPNQARRVLRHIGVDARDVDIPAPDVRRQTSAMNERWVRECLATPARTGQV
jgi:trehalose 2-sulfotransferase